jgi:urease accessory protein
MTQFSHLARRDKKREQHAVCPSANRLNWVTTKHTTKSGWINCEQFNRGQAMPGTGPRIALYLKKRNILLYLHAQQTSWRNAMFHVMSPPDLIDEFGLSPTPIVGTGRPSDKDLQRADGCGRIVLRGSENGTCIEDIFERSPIRIMFPRAGHRAVEEAVLINTAGGVAGGDRLEVCVTALPGASITVTSQAAEKVYRALNEPARVTTRLKARECARLAWLPQETIVFNSARLHRTTEIELTSGTELLALEWLVLGRAAHGEIMAGGSVIDGWRVKKDGRLIWADSFRITDEVFPQLHRKALLSNCIAIATLIYSGANLDERLEFLREIMPSLGCNCGVTLVGGVIVARFAANQAFDLRFALRSFLQQFGPEIGSGPFRVPKMWSC